MILSNEDIKKALEAGEIKITPKPKEEQIGPASVDLTLAEDFLKIKKEHIGKALDLDKIRQEDVTEKIPGKSIELKTGELVLGKTLEKIELPNNICGWIQGRSSFARLGTAIHITAAFIQPGSRNRQVLEMINFAPFSVTVRAGMRPCQVIFEKMKTKTTKPYYKVGSVAINQ